MDFCKNQNTKQSFPKYSDAKQIQLLHVWDKIANSGLCSTSVLIAKMFSVCNANVCKNAQSFSYQAFISTYEKPDSALWQ